MPNRLSILQLGRGNVGGTLIEQIAVRRRAIRDRFGIEIIYGGIAGSRTAVLAPGGIPLRTWREEVESGAAYEISDLIASAGRALADPKVLVDATAADGMVDIHCAALEAGFHVVTCNKKPLAGRLADYRRLRSAARAASRFYLHEVTVGAGLPVIATLRELVVSGDRIRAIEGCFSGTLNALCAGLDRGESFSSVLSSARERGFTEPDPRDDLSGQDVARKALILARVTGMSIEPEEVQLEPFCVTGSEGDADAYVAGAGRHDAEFAERWSQAAARGRRWRYVATVDATCSAGLREVPADGPLGRLVGPENVFALSTERYHEHPLVISGPGAGPEVTAAGAFGDILNISRAIARTGWRG
jgi:aspartokinase/homoserine dehydrogenase 1